MSHNFTSRHSKRASLGMRTPQSPLGQRSDGNMLDEQLISSPSHHLGQGNGMNDGNWPQDPRLRMKAGPAPDNAGSMIPHSSEEKSGLLIQQGNVSDPRSAFPRSHVMGSHTSDNSQRLGGGLRYRQGDGVSSIPAVQQVANLGPGVVNPAPVVPNQGLMTHQQFVNPPIQPVQIAVIQSPNRPTAEQGGGLMMMGMGNVCRSPYQFADAQQHQQPNPINQGMLTNSMPGGSVPVPIGNQLPHLMQPGRQLAPLRPRPMYNASKGGPFHQPPPPFQNLNQGPLPQAVNFRGPPSAAPLMRPIQSSGPAGGFNAKATDTSIGQSSSIGVSPVTRQPTDYSVSTAPNTAPGREPTRQGRLSGEPSVTKPTMDAVGRAQGNNAMHVKDLVDKASPGIERSFTPTTAAQGQQENNTGRQPAGQWSPPDTSVGLAQCSSGEQKPDVAGETGRQTEVISLLFSKFCLAIRDHSNRQEGFSCTPSQGLQHYVVVSVSKVCTTQTYISSPLCE